MKRLAEDPLVSTVSIFNEIRNCEYLYPMPITWQFLKVNVSNLDFNGNGVGATYDSEDKKTLLGMISIA
jgi:hypothetical protein